MKGRILAVLLGTVLAACAAEALRVPDNAPQTMQITWKRVGYFDLQRRCATGGQAYSQLAVTPGPVRQKLGCAVRNGNACTIYTTEHVYLEVVGHEIALHCFTDTRH